MTMNLKSHFLDYPHCCEFCDKVFIQKSRFIMHVRSHNKEKPFFCNYCDHSYADINALTMHIRKHFDDKLSNHNHSKITNSRTRANRSYRSKTTPKGSAPKLCVTYCRDTEVNAMKEITPQTQAKSAFVNDKKLTEGIKMENNLKHNIYEISEREVSGKQNENMEMSISDSGNIKQKGSSSLDSNNVGNAGYRTPLLREIGGLFDIVEESTEGKWVRTPHKTEHDLYALLKSLNLEIFHDPSFSKLFNLDVNYRQLYIIISGVDHMIAAHALICKQKYPLCENIPFEHREDMSCCIAGVRKP